MLEVHHIFKTYEGKPLLNDISFKVERVRRSVCLVHREAASQLFCGSSLGWRIRTRALSRLMDIDLTSTPPHLRDFGLVFQDYALFPHLNVNENVAFGLKMRRLPQDEIDTACSQFVGDGQLELDLERDRSQIYLAANSNVWPWRVPWQLARVC